GFVFPNPWLINEGASQPYLFYATTSFTDSPLTAAVTRIKAVHITELRTHIDSVRVARGLAAYTYSNPVLTPASTLIRAVDILELRTALNGAFSAALLPLPTYTNTIVTGATIRGVDIDELRTFVKVLE